jgi:hypothetical protein
MIAVIGKVNPTTEARRHRGFLFLKSLAERRSL